MARAIAAASAIAIAAPGARAAEPNERGAAAAEALFQEGRRLVVAKSYAEACPKFLASYEMSPAVGTLLNLADCYEKNGQTASAWARFHEAIALSERMHRGDREKVARERAEKLEPRLVKITIHAHETATRVSLDGNVVDASILGTPLPVDPGSHRIDVAASGKKPWSTTVDVREGKASPVIDVPALADERPVVVAAPRPIDTPTNGDGHGAGAQRVVGIALAAAGVLGVGVGAYFGVVTSQKWSDARTHCDASLQCDAAGVDLANDARTSGNVSTIAFVAGGALVAAGAVLYLTAPKKPERLRVGIGPGSVLLGGSF